MADQQLEALTTLASPLASGDQFLVNDVSDTTDDVGGSVRKVLFKTLGHDLSICTGRLTGTSGTYVTTSDVSSITTLYFCGPQGGNFRTWLYDGTVWNHFSYAQISKGLGTLTANLPYDVFLYDNSGTPDLEFLAWTSGGAGTSARATALATQDGVVVKSGDATRRYVGTFHTTSTTQTQDTVRQRLVWNYYNRRRKKLKAIESADFWSYNSATWRYANNNSSNRVEVVVGVVENAVDVTGSLSCSFNTGTSPAGSVGIGVNSNTANSADVFSEWGFSGSSTTATLTRVPLTAKYLDGLPIGFNYLALIEYCRVATVTFEGDLGTSTLQSGIVGSCFC